MWVELEISTNSEKEFSSHIKFRILFEYYKFETTEIEIKLKDEINNFKMAKNVKQIFKKLKSGSKHDFG